MAFKSPIKSPRPSRRYTKPLREKGKERNRRLKQTGRLKQDEKQSPTAKEITEITLKRLHTLGNQRFGSSPYSEHFDRWLANVSVVVLEFESNPNVTVDEQFVKERSDTLAATKLQLEKRRQKEASLNQAIENLSNYKSHLDQIKTEYIVRALELRKQKNSEIKRLQTSISQLRKEQDRVIQMKTGLFRGISRKERELQEMEITEKLADKQRELELVMLNFNEAKRKLQDEYEQKRTPIFVQIKKLEKTVEDMERDGSLEERWFACQKLVDTVNAFLLRRTLQPN